ncbi:MULTISPECIES: helix-turn-helix domain-containing protein [unclassified Pseudomonas]|uniref:AraC family transcriptional regulator n=1 Tax=unclassified Pseudomonas TaxID=196821 RepID=UPI00200CCEA3|nr:MULTISPECIES: helix-turn-helix domain-containing protein [unclassified Pseudomonas]
MSFSTSWDNTAQPSTLGALALTGAADMPQQSLLFATTDLGQANEQVSRVYTSYRYHTRGLRRDPASMYNMPGQSIGLSKFCYGTDITIEPEPFDDFVLVLTTLSGQSTISTPSVESIGGVGTTVLVAPGEHSRYFYDSDNSQLVTRIDCQRIVELAGSMSNLKPWEFPLSSQVINDDNQRALWHASLNQLRHILDPATSPQSRALLLPRAEELLILSLLCAQSDGYVSRSPLSSGVNPAYLKRAVAYIEEHADQAVTLLDIAEAAHCGIRSLHRSFHEWRGISPMRYLKEVRLRNVRQALLNPSEGDCVTDLATRWGFLHLGQFSVDYRRAFGEKPSDTFRRAR